MIRFKKIRYKNFLSFGEMFQEIELDKSPTTLITGENGAGKSTFLDALTFVLYNKPFRKINKPQLVNSINKKRTMVEIEFSSGGLCYLVRRGIKPSVFEIYRGESFDGLDTKENLLPQDAANGDYQTYLEKNILKMNYQAFTQVVILGKATYVPFMRLDAAKRRAVIEDLLGLKIFGTMNTVLKDKAKSLKVDLRDCESQIDILIDKIDNRQRYIDQITDEREQRLDDIKTQVSELEKAITKGEANVTKLMEHSESLQSKVDGESELRSKLRKLDGFSAKFTAKIGQIKNDIAFFTDNDNCPTCTQPITEEFRDEQVVAKQEKIGEIETAQGKLEADIDDVLKTIEDIESVNREISKVDRKIGELQTAIREQNRQVTRLNKEYTELSSVSMDEEEAIVADLTKELTSLRETKTELQETAAYYMNIGSMLKDDGIKTLIINKYLPIFNTQINKFLKKMGFHVKFHLDEQFNEQILSRYRDDFSYNNFSEGQKLRIDLAILMTWREVAKMKNSLNTNLLIMDEVFDSSLDQEGVDAFMDLIPALGDSNIFVVSHTPDKLYDKFRDNIRFTINKNFSIMEST